MAITGIVLFGFVLVHMLGNMKLYFGPEHYNEYSHWLREVGSPTTRSGTASVCRSFGGSSGCRTRSSSRAS
jgi:succinate dehydrogenase/fumarate reductase cytochrome b subunit